MRNPWTQEQDDFLRNNWSDQSDEEIGKELGRSKTAIRCRRYSLNDLAKEYLQTAEKIKERLDKLTTGNWKATKDESKRAYFLRMEYDELIDAARTLKKHSEKEDKYGYLPIRKDHERSGL